MQRSSLRTALITTTALTAALLFIDLPVTEATAQIATGGGAGGNTFGASGGTGGIAGGGGGAGAEDGVPGGAGGNAATSFSGTASGGGGSNGAADGGAAGSPNDVSAGGGGGGSSSGGAGGAGGAGGQVGDAGALPPSFTGNNGLPAGTAGDKDGGGGGGSAGLVWTDPTTGLEFGSQTVQGGSGGDGASGAAGGGGGGGAGLVVESNVTVHLSSGGQINGGAGGATFNANSASGGGGAGLFMFNGGTFTNDGGTVRGGSAGSAIINFGNGGAGFLGNGATVNNNSGSITGGSGATGGAGAEIYGGTITNGTSTNATASITGGTGLSGAGGQGVLALSGDAVTITNFGTISGGSGTAGGIGVEIDADNSTVINSGTISGATIAVKLAGADDRFELQSGYQIFGTVVATGSNATLAFGGTTDASFDVSTIDTGYQGFSALDKSGTSTWTLTGTSTFTGPMTVDGGTLLVNGDTRTFSQITVNAGATLGGSGTVGTTMINGGTLTGGTGDANGLLTVNGSLTFTAASTYLVQVSPSSVSQVSATGSAALGSAGVSAVFASGSYVSKQYTILTAAGGVNGTFSGPVNTNLPANFTSALSYDSKNAYLNLTLNFTPPSGGGGTPDSGNGGTPAAAPFGSGLNLNQQHIANVLENFFNANGGIPLAFGALTPQGLTQAAGETATSAQQTTFDAMNLFMGLISDPTEHGTTAAPAPSSPYQAYAAMPTKAVPLQSAFAPGWSTWASGFGGSQTTDGNSATGSNTVTSRIFGGAAGADYHLAPDTLLGFALMGGGTNFSVANGGSGRSDLFQAGAFGRQNFGAGYVSAALAYGWQDITTDRYVIGNHLQAQFDANTYSGRIEGGYRFAVPNMAGLGLTPYAAAQVTVFDLPAYAEQAIGGGVFALNYASKDVTDTRSELGLRADKSFVVGDAILTLRGRAAWAHDFDTDRSVSATFQTLPGASFVVNGAALAPDSALVSASAETKWANGWSVAATFDGEFSDVTASYAAKGVVRYDW
jgi:uncharacterized protein with beta-barrel porin domain